MPLRGGNRGEDEGGKKGLFVKGEGAKMASEKSKTLLKLFTSTLYISAFTFGGGFVIITFMKKKFVDEYHWIEENEMLDLAALAQSSPGAIAVNAAILVGWRMGGFPGMLTAVFGTIIPPMALLSVISFFYAAFAANPYIALLLKGMQAGVAAVILDVVCGLGKGVLKNKDIVHMIVMAAAFLATFVWGVNVIYIILAAAFAGICTELWKRKGGKER
ncbi:chromate transporter [bacterium D16-50]|nr:chromate transporter [bacterium D16-50]